MEGVEMITETQIIEAAKECGFWQEHTNTWMCSTEAMIEVAQHWYRKGLIDAAEKCESEAKDPHNAPACIVARRCSEAIRQMAEEA
jgi:hypothetical protein